MPIRATCPECETNLKLPDSFQKGKRIRCPKCQAAITPHLGTTTEITAQKPTPRAAPGGESRGSPRKTAREEDDRDDDVDREDSDDRPRSKKKKRKKARPSKLGLWIGLGAGGAVLLAAVVIVGVIVSRSGSAAKPGGPVAVGPAVPGVPGVIPNPNSPAKAVVDPPVYLQPYPLPNMFYSSQSVQSLKTGLTLEEARRVLGQSQTQEDVIHDPLVYAHGNERFHMLAPRVVRWEAWWGDKDNRTNGLVVAGFLRAKDGELRLCCSYGVTQTEVAKGKQRNMHFGPSGGIDGLPAKEQAVADRDAYLNDPRWIKGPAIREKILGSWKASVEGAIQSMSGAHFQPDGKVVVAASFPPFAGNLDFTFVDDETVEIHFAPKSVFARKERFRVFLEVDRLQLVALDERTGNLSRWIPPMKREGDPAKK